MPTTAISYIRFSTVSQASGSSLTRQFGATQALCASKGWVLSDLRFKDLGLSGFDGSHIERGELGALLKLINEGQIEKGTVLVLESLDRLSRQTIPEALGLFLRLLGSGLEIYTIHDNQHYTNERISRDTSSIFISISIMMRANEESETKSKRVKAAYQIKKDKGIAHTSRVPNWINNDKGKLSINEELADVIRVIFQKYLDGYGCVMLATYMNTNHPRNEGKLWTSTQLNTLLKTPSVIGHLVSTKDDGTTFNYYPAIIPEVDFYKVQERLKRNQGTGKKADGIANLFKSKCLRCGSSIRFGGSIGKTDTRMLRCEASIGGVCNAESLRYKDFEEQLLKYIFDNYSDAKIIEQPDDSKMVYTSKLNAVVKQIDNLTKALAMVSSPDAMPTLVNMITKLEIEATELRAKLAAYVPKSSLDGRIHKGALIYQQWIKGDYKDLDEIRLKLRGAITDLGVVAKIAPGTAKPWNTGGHWGRMIELEGEFADKVLGTDLQRLFIVVKPMRKYMSQRRMDIVKDLGLPSHGMKKLKRVKEE